VRIYDRAGLAAFALVLGLLSLDSARASESTAPELESKISLGEVRGRIDHLAFDLPRQRLFVAELGNDSVGVVDLREGKTIKTVTHLAEPQGIGYVLSTDTVYVANARDGSVRLFQGADLVPEGQIALGEDADNIRVDDAAQRVFVGYGSGALAVIDASMRRKIADIPLKAHPESFQLDASSARIFVNVPEAHEIAVVDRMANTPLATWKTDSLQANFPMALEQRQQRVLSIFRHPAKMGVFGASDGRLLTAVDTCRDADDVHFDAKRDRVYVSCGEGFVQVFVAQGNTYADLGRVATAPGARTSLFVPGIDRLLLAVRAAAGIPAAIWVFRPQ
jgi:DNA-binding beta-propeller fold protein YncE